MLFPALMLAGCATQGASTGPQAGGPRLEGVEARPLGAGAWTPYLNVMSERERVAFHQVTDEPGKHAFLRHHGIDVRHTLADGLTPGMSRGAVRSALEGLNADEPIQSRGNRLYLTHFNGTARTHVYCTFSDADGTLLGWGSYTDEQAVAHRRADSVASVFAIRLNDALRVGMGQDEILYSRREAQELMASFEARVRERMRDASYPSRWGAPDSEAQGWDWPSASDFSVEGDYVRSQGLTTFYDILGRRPNVVRAEAGLETWYHVLPIEGEQELKLVLEFRFRDKALHSWFVYTTDFLGFDGYK